MLPHNATQTCIGFLQSRNARTYYIVYVLCYFADKLTQQTRRTHHELGTCIVRANVHVSDLDLHGLDRPGSFAHANIVTERLRSFVPLTLHLCTCYAGTMGTTMEGARTIRRTPPHGTTLRHPNASTSEQVAHKLK